jgi:hypothetical protein
VTVGWAGRRYGRRAALGPTLAFATFAYGQNPSPPQTYRGLELSVAGVEHASSAALSDCPAGANTQRAMARPGEGFAIVRVKARVLPAYQPGPLKRPTLTGVDGKVYYTAASFVDIGKASEFSCAFPFRVPDGTKLKSLQIETVSFDLTQR